MNVQIDQLVKSLLQKDSLESCSLQEVKEYADRNPYFGAAQLLLTKKLQIENAEGYDDQLQKTFLFFHNPLWVEALLNDSGKATVIEKKKEEPVQSKMHASEPETNSFEQEIANSETSNEKNIAEADNTDMPLNAEQELLNELPTFKFEHVDPLKEELLFEPFHTVDYFASQGINFKEEEKPADKFGMQLKSFTDWLKTMKKLPAAENIEEDAPISEKKVVQLAEHSILERDIVTIAMAEVWEKQGNKEKAIDIYNKLSLLEPSKSPYFAAKIEDLKKSN